MGIGDALDTSACKRILQSVGACSKPLIIFTGGEPLERDDIFELIAYAKSLGLPSALATCGYKLDSNAAENIKTAGIGAVSLSLDGPTRQMHDSFRKSSGAFDAVVNASGILKAHGIRFQINSTITTHNADMLDELARIAGELGAACFNIFILVPTGRGEAISSQLLDRDRYESVLEKLAGMKREMPIDLRVTCGPQFARIMATRDAPVPVKGCLGGKEFGFISYRADIQICGFLDISAGNLAKNDFDFGKLWASSDFLNSIRNRPSFKGKCAACEYLETCSGCRARAYAVTGDFLASDPICQYRPTK